MNYIDLLIILFLAYFLFFGYRRGFIRQVLDLVVLILAFLIAGKSFEALGSLFGKFIELPASILNVFAFFIIWFVIESIYYVLYLFFYERIPEEVRKSKINKYFGLIPAFARFILFVWIILNVILILPLPERASSQIKGSFLGKYFVRTTALVEKYVGNIFSGAISDTLKFITITPQSNEKVELGFTVKNGTLDPKSEENMLVLINKERTDRGLKPLKMDDKLREVARAHSKDMFEKGYFAHNNLEGLTPFDRMNGAGIEYMVAGENLALAPTVSIAHDGLMNSPGHKANILTTEFEKVGLGVIDGGQYGKMFSQEFTN